ncbi:hypothetical protein MRX96_037554 [Rhipicephalus microplus]
MINPQHAKRDAPGPSTAKCEAKKRSSSAASLTERHAKGVKSAAHPVMDCNVETEGGNTNEGRRDLLSLTMPSISRWTARLFPHVDGVFHVTSTLIPPSEISHDKVIFLKQEEDGRLCQTHQNGNPYDEKEGLSFAQAEAHMKKIDVASLCPGAIKKNEPHDGPLETFASGRNFRWHGEAFYSRSCEDVVPDVVSPTAEASVHALGGQSYRPRSRPQIVGCYRCGAKGHGPEDCRFRSASCFKCKQRGHIARACCRRESGFGVVPPERQVHALSREEDTGTDGMFALEAADSHIGHVGITQPIVRTLDCGGVPVNMQVDTGSPVSVITWPTYERNKTVWPKLRGSPLKLTCFLGRLPVRGQLQLKVSCGNKSTAGSLQVLGCSGPNLCGRDLIQAFHMLEAPVMNVNTSGWTTQCPFRPHQLTVPPLDGWQPGEPVWVRNFGRGEPWNSSQHYIDRRSPPDRYSP